MEEIVLTLVTRRGVVRPTICSDVEVATMVGRHGGPSANAGWMGEVAGLAIAETTVQYEYPLGAYIVTGATTPSETASGTGILYTDGTVDKADFTDCKKVESLTWDTAGHYVANLIAVQVLLSLLAMALTRSDFYVTIPPPPKTKVMTYICTICWPDWSVSSCCSWWSLLYADVARIYRGTANCDLIWLSLSTILVRIFFVVVNVTTDRYKIAQTSKTAYFSKDTMTLSTVCHLVPTLAKLLTIIPEQLSPQIYGMIDKNSFTSQHTSDD
ncbi:hypothetical protein H257_12072 [Aphanomyces astaci]|uniref:Uncharacterized protein n=1 Tax=Aphanomyces astaci TaxID=112090 RepID=W4G1V7_APHAT|nr:hypothetical protein H257_12072 [Aphanomyces astaci]ETV73034.1 hypothetical protein H257_12072 [Aphanomyces astaci]|eukprot:XP_009837483.1 hypothetical protein H257_12072 [Aphanomyces astaci]